MDTLEQIEEINIEVKRISMFLDVLRSKLLFLKGCVRMGINSEDERADEQTVIDYELYKSSGKERSV